MTVEGGGSSYSAGMTNYELAVALVRLGARTAMGLGSGTSAAMAFDGTLLTRATEQPIADALVLSYSGVYVAPPVSTTLSPNGDGIDDVQTFSYKLVRPSQVTATVVGPDRSVLTLAQDSEQAGVHTLQWDGKTAVEGSWRFSVTATDDLGHTTTADRQFAVNQTLGFLQVAPKGAGATATFQLAHSATVTVTVEKANGIVLATLLSKKLDPGRAERDMERGLRVAAIAFASSRRMRSARRRFCHRSARAARRLVRCSRASRRHSSRTSPHRGRTQSSS